MGSWFTDFFFFKVVRILGGVSISSLTLIKAKRSTVVVLSLVMELSLGNHALRLRALVSSPIKLGTAVTATSYD